MNPEKKHMKILLMFVLMSACAGTSTSTRLDPAAVDGIARLQSATRAFQSLDSAVAAGYAANVRDCLVHEHHGAMGYHHVNRSYVDAKAEVERPEILLYERAADGKARLNGVEYIVPYAAWSRDSAPPVLMGQKLKREDNLNIWYLHVWAWNENPDGVFADYHPRVTCPDNARRVFMTFERR